MDNYLPLIKLYHFAWILVSKSIIAICTRDFHKWRKFLFHLQQFTYNFDIIANYLYLVTGDLDVILGQTSYEREWNGEIFTNVDFLPSPHPANLPRNCPIWDDSSTMQMTDPSGKLLRGSKIHFKVIMSITWLVLWFSFACLLFIKWVWWFISNHHVHPYVLMWL